MAASIAIVDACDHEASIAFANFMSFFCAYFAYTCEVEFPLSA